MKTLITLLFIPLCYGALAQSVSYKDNVFTEYFRRDVNGNWLASDATISIPLPDGRVIWLFGDTHLEGYNAADTTVPCLFHVNNSMMVQDPIDRNNMITILDRTETGNNRTPVKQISNDALTLFWPGHCYAKGDTAHIFWQRYQKIP